MVLEEIEDWKQNRWWSLLECIAQTGNLIKSGHAEIVSLKVPSPPTADDHIKIRALFLSHIGRIQSRLSNMDRQRIPIRLGKQIQNTPSDTVSSALFPGCGIDNKRTFFMPAPPSISDNMPEMHWESHSGFEVPAAPLPDTVQGI